MRLTLRTMLAYLDDILEPADAQEIAKKVGESEFATNLMHRIRDVTRRLRLAAPKLEGKGMGLDPNTVAEYLDNMLPGERVPDFEKVCLESDVHLAEVAAAHQILALVLGEPAEVKPGWREKMYELGNAAPEVLTPPPAPRPVETGVFAEAQARRKSVPDYLREPPPRKPRRWLAAAMVLLLAGGAAAVGLNWDRMPWMQRPVAQNPLPSSTEPTSVTTTTTSTTTTTTTQTSGTPAMTSSPDTTATVVTPDPGLVAPTNVAPPPPDATAPAGSPDSVPPATPGPTPPGPTNTAPPEVPKTATPDVAPPNATSPPSLVNPVPDAGPSPASAAASTPAAPTPDEVGSVSTPKPPPPPAQPEPVGRVFSEREVIVRFDQASKLWQRVITGATIFTGDNVLSLPTYRPGVALSAGINIQFRGPSSVIFLPNDAAGVPGLQVDYGRLMLLSVGRPGAKINVILAGRKGTITFGAGDATVAVDVEQLHNDGANPELDDPQTIVDLYATTGQIEWSDETTSGPEMLAAPAKRSLGLKVADAGEASAATPPVWITGDDRSAIEKLASPEVEAALTPDRPVMLSLRELVGHRKTEVGALASRCLAQVGEFDSFITLLNDEKQRASWDDQISALRETLAHSPASAVKVHEAFLRARGPEGDQLYRMLWAYSPAQLQAGAAATLVDELDHEDLDFRVLAFWNLHRVTNKTNLYRPEYTGAKRTQYVLKWRQQLESGTLLPD